MCVCACRVCVCVCVCVCVYTYGLTNMGRASAAARNTMQVGGAESKYVAAYAQNEWIYFRSLVGVI